MKNIWFVLFICGCAPISPSIPKSQLCEVPSEYMSRYNSVKIGDSWNGVQYTMQETPTVSGDVQTYKHCKTLTFTFTGSSLITKEIK